MTNGHTADAGRYAGGAADRAWLRYLDTHWDAWLADLRELLAIPSVSTDADLRAEVRRAADWTAARLRRAGIEGVHLLETPGHPSVYGQWLHAPGRPTVLIYGHFDVQPPDPLERWTSPPFEPAVRDGRLYARGASDMKGNLLLPVAACEAMLRTAGALPVNVKFLYEGEEEVFSPFFAPLVAEHAALLACDLAVSADSGQAGERQPALRVGSRGIAGLQVDVRTAATDAHSGVAGGLLPNAAQVLAHILASLRSPEGRILVPGFYDDVVEPTPAEMAELAALPDPTGEVLRSSGASALVGEPGYGPRERNAIRPTLDVNGMWSGFTGEGSKTVIPCEAHAKLTCRLVPRQTPRRSLDLLEAHIRRLAPAEAEVSVARLAGSADPYLMPSDTPALAAADRVLSELYGRAPWRLRHGATVPATSILRAELGVWTVSFGFALPDERIHAPDEFVRLENMRRGRRAFGRLFEEIAADAAAG